MQFHPEEILAILDQCSNSFTFPMLDNGYVYLAASRLSLYRSDADWAMVIEIFGFSPRSGLPDTHIYTFASRLHDREAWESHVHPGAYEMYLANNPHNESRFAFPVREGSWQEADYSELVAEDAKEVMVRGQTIRLPQIDEYANHGIELEQAPKVQVFELCRYLAEIVRDEVLATANERRMSVLPEMHQILQLEEWHHPNVVDESDRPSGSETFQQLAQVLATGDVAIYRPARQANNHWRNWPDGGSL